MCIYTHIRASHVKHPPVCIGDVRDPGSVPGWKRSPGEGHGNLLQYSCMEHPMDTGDWQTTVHRVTKSQIQLKRLSMHSCIHIYTQLLCVRFL